MKDRQKKKYEKINNDHQNTTVLGVRVIVFDDNFNNISVISWRSDLLVEETGENH